jgi:cell division protein FtsB
VTTHSFTRAVTIFAVGFLLLNAILLAMIGHPVWAAVCAVAAALAVLGWFRYRRALQELADARKELKREVESLRDLLHTHRRSSP